MRSVQIPRAASRVQEEWDRLRRGTDQPQYFDPASIANLPAPARRWLIHAIVPDSPLARSVELQMHGHIRLGA